MIASIQAERGLTRPVYTATIRRAGVVLWQGTFKDELAAISALEAAKRVIKKEQAHA